MLNLLRFGLQRASHFLQMKFMGPWCQCNKPQKLGYNSYEMIYLLHEFVRWDDYSQYMEK